MKFAEKLVLLRKKQGLSQEALAERIGVTRQAVSRWEAGDTLPETAVLIRLCAVFSVSADYLILEEAEREEEVSAVKAQQAQALAASIRKKEYRLIAVACFFIGAVCFAMGILSDAGHWLKAFFGVNAAALLALAVIQFVLYLKDRRK